MKILFINPLLFFPEQLTESQVRNNSIHLTPPLGLLYVAAYIRQNFHGIKVKVIDYNYEYLKYAKLNGLTKTCQDFSIENILKENSPFNTVCVTAPFSLYKNNIFEVIDKVKKYDHAATIIVGGAFPTFQPEKCLENKNIDYIVLGEGEKSCAELINFLFSVQDRDLLTRVKGIGYVENGKKIISYRNDFIEKLDELPFPLYDQINITDYPKFGRFNTIAKYMEMPPAMMTTSRGCPSNCIFCGVPRFWGKKIRYRSVENALQEIRMMKDKYGISHFIFNDSNLTHSKNFAMDFFNKIISEKLNIKWCSPDGIAPYTLDEALIDLMIRSGCYSISLGIESGNEYILKNILRKPLNLKLLREKVEILAKYRNDVYVSGLFMLGIPYETKEQMHQTIYLARELELDWNEFAVTLPYPNTELWDICVKEKFISKNSDDTDSLTYMHSYIRTPEFSVEEVRDIAYSANIEVNFLNNPNFVKLSINRAIEDFQRIVNRYPEHSIAKYMLYKSFLKKNMNAAAEQCKSELILLLSENQKSRELFTKYNLSL